MPENYCARIIAHRPLRGEFMCVPLASYKEYELARYLIFSRSSGSGSFMTEEFVHGSLAQGGLILGQRPVNHCGLRGDAVFSLSFIALKNTSDMIRIGSSLSYGYRAYFGNYGSMGVLLDNGTTVAPKNGVFSTSGYAVRSLAYNLPFAKPTQTYLIGEIGYLFENLSRRPRGASYIMDERSWNAYPRSDGKGYISAAGWKRRWEVSVEWVDNTIVCLAHTIENLQCKVVSSQLVWQAVAALSNNRTFTTYSSVTSGAFEASSDEAFAFRMAVERARHWASVDLYENEHRQALNDALDSYRTLRSNNIENALQWSKLSKLLPTEAARLVPKFKSIKSASTKALVLAKIFSLAYLWWRYVAKTTYRDLKQLMDSIPQLLPPNEGEMDLKGRVVTTREYEFENQTWVSALCRVDPYDLSLLPMRWGIHPGLAQAWDLIPLSFVVDWIFGVSNQLNAIDWFVYHNFFRLSYLIRTRRTEVRVDASDFGGAGEVTLSVYNRQIQLSWPGLLDSIPNPRHVPIKNWAVAAAALAISLTPGPR